MTDDLICPECGANDAWQELAFRWTFQNVQLDERGVPTDYDSFDYGDEVYMVGIACTECDACWPTYNDLKLRCLGKPHATGQAEISFKDGIPT